MKKGIFITAVILCVFLNACGEPYSELTPVPGWETEEDTVKTLRWYYGNAVTVNMAEAIAEDYLNQTGIAVEWISMEDMERKEIFASGREPDVFSLAAYDIQEWKERLYQLDGQSFTENAFDISLEAATIEGNLYAMPVTYEACGILYNKELFRKAGITGLPRTLQELEEICRKLSAAGIQPFGECYQLSGFAGHTLSVLFAYEPELEIYMEELESGRKTIGDMKYYSQWLTLFDLMSDYGLGSDSVNYSIDDQIVDFAEGKMAMIKQGTWLEKQILQTNPDISMGLMAIPCTQNGADCRLMVATTNFIGVNRNSEYREEAVEFLNWLYENMEKYFVNIDGSSVCYYNVKTDGLAALNTDATDYIQKGMAFMHFGSESWPSGYNDDVMQIFHRYLTGVIKKDELDDELTGAYMTRISS